ncbi:hypothetical protein YC2023_006013 [Brassica napus]
MNWKLGLLIGLMLLLSITLNPTLARVTYPSRTTKKGIGNIHLNKGMKIGFRGSVIDRYIYHNTLFQTYVENCIPKNT